MSSIQAWRMNLEKRQGVLGIVKSPSKRRPINHIGLKLKGILVTSLNQSVSISSLPYCKIQERLYICA